MYFYTLCREDAGLWGDADDRKTHSKHLVHNRVFTRTCNWGTVDNVPVRWLFMKEKSISVTKSPKYNPKKQCYGKKQYKLKRKALKDAQSLTRENPEEIFSVYECPHCGKYHVGSVPK